MGAKTKMGARRAAADLVVPIDLEIVIVEQLGKVAELLLDAVHVQGGAQLCDRTVGVAEQSPTLHTTPITNELDIFFF